MEPSHIIHLILKKQVKILFATALAALFFIQGVVLVHALETNLWTERQKSIEESQLAALPQPIVPSLLTPQKSTLSDLPIVRDPMVASVIPGWVQAAVAPFATIQGVKRSPTEHSKTVLLMQDAHLHFEAQTHIAGAIDQVARSLKDRSSYLLVGMEGLGVLNPNYTPYHKLKKRKALRDVGEALLKHKIINGIEYAVMGHLGDNSQGPVQLPFQVIGVEKESEYEANVKALRDSLPIKEEVSAILNTLKTKLTGLKAKYYSQALKEHDKKFESYYSGALPVPDYVLHLDSLVPATGPHSRHLIEAALIEGSLDYNRVENERLALLKNLISKISPQETQDLIGLSAYYREGQISYGDYYKHFKSLCQKHQMNLAQYPELNLYIQYVLKTDGINTQALFAEVRRLEASVHQLLIQNEKQKELIQLNLDYHLLKKLAQNSLTEEEWNLYAERQSQIRQLVSRFERHGFGVPKGTGNLRDHVEVLEKFYRVAVARNTTMGETFSRELVKADTNMGLLVVGGFHTQAIAQDLYENGFNVVTLSPKITRLEDGPTSLEILASNRLPIDQLFAGERLFLPIPPTGHTLPTQQFNKAVYAGYTNSLEVMPEGYHARVGQAEDKDDGAIIEVKTTPVSVRRIENKRRGTNTLGIVALLPLLMGAASPVDLIPGGAMNNVLVIWTTLFSLSVMAMAADAGNFKKLIRALFGTATAKEEKIADEKVNELVEAIPDSELEKAAESITSIFSVSKVVDTETGVVYPYPDQKTQDARLGRVLFHFEKLINNFKDPIKKWMKLVEDLDGFITFHQNIPEVVNLHFVEGAKKDVEDLLKQSSGISLRDLELLGMKYGLDFGKRMTAFLYENKGIVKKWVGQNGDNFDQLKAIFRLLILEEKKYSKKKQSKKTNPLTDSIAILDQAVGSIPSHVLRETGVTVDQLKKTLTTVSEKSMQQFTNEVLEAPMRNPETNVVYPYPSREVEYEKLSNLLFFGGRIIKHPTHPQMWEALLEELKEIQKDHEFVEFDLLISLLEGILGEREKGGSVRDLEVNTEEHRYLFGYNLALFRLRKLRQGEFIEEFMKNAKNKNSNLRKLFVFLKQNEDKWKSNWPFKGFSPQTILWPVLIGSFLLFGMDGNALANVGLDPTYINSLPEVPLEEIAETEKPTSVSLLPVVVAHALLFKQALKNLVELRKDQKRPTPVSGFYRWLTQSNWRQILILGDISALFILSIYIISHSSNLWLQVSLMPVVVLIGAMTIFPVLFESFLNSRLFMRAITISQRMRSKMAFVTIGLFVFFHFLLAKSVLNPAWVIATFSGTLLFGLMWNPEASLNLEFLKTGAKKMNDSLRSSYMALNPYPYGELEKEKDPQPAHPSEFQKKNGYPGFASSPPELEKYVEFMNGVWDEIQYYISSGHAERQPQEVMTALQNVVILLNGFYSDVYEKAKGGDDFMEVGFIRKVADDVTEKLNQVWISLGKSWPEEWIQDSESYPVLSSMIEEWDQISTEDKFSWAVFDALVEHYGFEESIETLADELDAYVTENQPEFDVASPIRFIVNVARRSRSLIENNERVLPKILSEVFDHFIEIRNHYGGSWPMAWFESEGHEDYPIAREVAMAIDRTLGVDDNPERSAGFFNQDVPKMMIDLILGNNPIGWWALLTFRSCYSDVKEFLGKYKDKGGSSQTWDLLLKHPMKSRKFFDPLEPFFNGNVAIRYIENAGRSFKAPQQKPIFEKFVYSLDGKSEVLRIVIDKNSLKRQAKILVRYFKHMEKTRIGINKAIEIVEFSAVLHEVLELRHGIPHEALVQAGIAPFHPDVKPPASTDEVVARAINLMLSQKISPSEVVVKEHFEKFGVYPGFARLNSYLRDKVRNPNGKAALNYAIEGIPFPDKEVTSETIRDFLKKRKKVLPHVKQQIDNLTFALEAGDGTQWHHGSAGRMQDSFDLDGEVVTLIDPVHGGLNFEVIRKQLESKGTIPAVAMTKSRFDAFIRSSYSRNPTDKNLVHLVENLERYTPKNNVFFLSNSAGYKGLGDYFNQRLVELQPAQVRLAFEDIENQIETSRGQSLNNPQFLFVTNRNVDLSQLAAVAISLVRVFEAVFEVSPDKKMKTYLYSLTQA
jgi:hypothetical protein